MFAQDGNKLIFRYDAEQLWIEPWGPDALRIRATKNHQMPTENWALDITPPPLPARPTISIDAANTSGATITNGKIQASLTPRGKLTVRNAHTGALLLEEYSRNRKDVTDPKCSALEIEAREFRPIPGSDAFEVTARFEPIHDDDGTGTKPARERIYGMGQYQQPQLDLRGADLELAHRNSQASVPFALSSRGYGFLWNNPAVGRAVFGTNVMSFAARATKALDYWVVVGDGPREVERAYAGVTGTVPMMPEFGLGFWQCKLRYQTQEELLGVAREYRRRGLPIDLIVVDFFHWPKQGEWKFDPKFWPDPDAMIRELKELKIELMVSIWPTVDKLSENYDEMVEKGYLIRMDRGVRTAMDFMGDTVHADFTNPAAREYVWQKAKQNYWDKGIRVFWIDEAEPEYTAYDFDNYRYHLGPNLQIGNLYPLHYARAFHDGQTAAGQTTPVVNLARCAWASSQKYGALVWSGDVASSWPVFRSQLAAGLNMGLAGIPWWTTDIGGFHGGDARDAAFRELLVRWFQWGAFCPVMRLHGDREPRQPQVGEGGGAACRSGAPNEVWSYGEEVYGICERWMRVREGLRGYTRELMREAHEKGDPVMRTCFYEFPDDARAWEVEDQYMFGAKYLVAPVLYPGVKTRSVYFPKGATWKAFEGEATYEGGTTAEVETPIESMPVFVRQ